MTRFAAATRLSAVASLVLIAGCGAGIYPYSLDPKPPVPAPQITFSPSALTFSAVSGQTSAAQTITVGNSGNATLNLASITLLDTTNYVITSNNCVLTLAPAATCSISVAFTPQSAATLNSALHFVDNSNNVANAAQDVALNGIGTAVPMPIAQLLPTTLTFPDTPTATSAASQSLTLKNIGTAPLLLSSFSVTGTSYAVDTVNSTCTSLSSLAVGSTCAYIITFTPQNTGAQSGSLTVTDNSNNIVGSTQVSTFTGNGTAPAPIITINPTSLTFGSQTLSTTSAVQTVTIGNSGNATLALASITLNDPDDYIVTNNCGSTLAPNATCTLSVSFNPQNLGSLPSTITLTDNTNNVTGSQQNITLSATGLAPAAPNALLTPASQTCPDTVAGSTSPCQTITLMNNGTAQLNFTNITYSGTGFNESTTCTGGFLPVASSCAFTVTFAPAATGPYSGSVTVTDNSGGVAGSTQTATFSGTGTPNTASALVLSPATPVQFPNTPANSTSASQPFVLTNFGSGAATGLTIATTGGSSATAFKIATNTCGTTLAGGATCNIGVTFAPTVAGTYQAYLTAADTNTPTASTVSTELDAVAVAPCSGNLFSPTSITFPTTKVGTTSNTLTSTLTNCGTAPLVITSIVLGGTNPTNFTQTNNCPVSPASVAAGGTCTVSATFTPSAVASYSATVTFTDNGGTSPQTLPLSGTGTNSSISYQLYQFPDPDFTTKVSTGALNAIYALINSAQSTIDMTMYEMQDTTFTNDLIARCKAGVKVRVIFSSSVASSSSTAYNALNAQTNCAAEDSNTAFTNTHQKTITVDGATTAVMSLNLQSQYYTTTRDFAMIYNDPNDITAIENTFAKDWAAGTPFGGTQGASDFSYIPSTGTDLIWSPTTAQAAMTNIIANAQHDLTIENEELASSASYIINALVTACQKGVIIHFTIVNQSSYAAGFQTLKTAGCDPHVYADTTNGFYVHAKSVVADYGLSTQSVYMGSINYSNASMNQNRELGLYVTDPTSVTKLYTTMSADYAGGTAY